MAADRRKHEMTNRKMFFAMLWGAVFRRRSRAVMAVIASLVGAATLFCLASVCIAVPQQMNEEMRAYGANLIVTPADATSKSEGISTATITNVTALVTAEHSAKSAAYRYESVRINSAPYTLAGVNPKAVQTLNRHWNVTGDWPSEGNVMVGRDVADALGVHIGSRIPHRLPCLRQFGRVLRTRIVRFWRIGQPKRRKRVPDVRFWRIGQSDGGQTGADRIPSQGKRPRLIRHHEQ